MAYKPFMGELSRKINVRHSGSEDEGLPHSPPTEVPVPPETSPRTVGGPSASLSQSSKSLISCGDSSDGERNSMDLQDLDFNVLRRAESLDNTAAKHKIKVGRQRRRSSGSGAGSGDLRKHKSCTTVQLAGISEESPAKEEPLRRQTSHDPAKVTPEKCSPATRLAQELHDLKRREKDEVRAETSVVFPGPSPAIPVIRTNRASKQKDAPPAANPSSTASSRHSAGSGVNTSALAASRIERLRSMFTTADLSEPSAKASSERAASSEASERVFSLAGGPNASQVLPGLGKASSMSSPAKAPVKEPLHKTNTMPADSKLFPAAAKTSGSNATPKTLPSASPSSTKLFSVTSSISTTVQAAPSKTGSSPAVQSASKTATTSPAVQSASKTGSSPAVQSASKTGSSPAVQSASKTGTSPAVQSATTPAVQSASKTGSSPAVQSASKTGSSPAVQSTSSRGPSFGASGVLRAQSSSKLFTASTPASTSAAASTTVPGSTTGAAAVTAPSPLSKTASLSKLFSGQGGGGASKVFSASTTPVSSVHTTPTVSKTFGASSSAADSAAKLHTPAGSRAYSGTALTAKASDHATSGLLPSSGPTSSSPSAPKPLSVSTSSATITLSSPKTSPGVGASLSRDTRASSNRTTPSPTSPSGSKFPGSKVFGPTAVSLRQVGKIEPTEPRASAPIRDLTSTANKAAPTAESTAKPPASNAARSSVILREKKTSVESKEEVSSGRPVSRVMDLVRNYQRMQESSS